jgi:hypothetical protein
MQTESTTVGYFKLLLELKPGCLGFPTHQGQEVTTANHAVATTQIHTLYWDVQQ